MEQEVHISTPLDHPCYEGHFPGRPIVPGVLLLDVIVRAIARGAPSAVDSVKFHVALTPGQAFTLHWISRGPRVTFRCERDAQVVAEGILTFGAP